MKGFLTSSEGRAASYREGETHLMNGLIDGYRDGGRDMVLLCREEGGPCGHPYNKQTNKKPEHIV